MNSAGETSPQNYIRAVNAVVDALGATFEVALSKVVPAKHRDAVRALRANQKTKRIERIRGVSAEGGPKAWFEDWEPADGFYWPRQRAYLVDHVGRSPEEVQATDDDSSRVLSYLEDPRETGSFSTKGLVLGHVQSGKTENFSALIAKAADLGYQVVIVFGGIHNGLRQQTQRRLERELGLQDVEPGVGLPEAGRRWNNPTTADLYGDFNPGTSDASILQGNEKVIFVIKKWHTVLDRLVTFIQNANAPEDLSVLVIDDEADQASINTGGNRTLAPENVTDDTGAMVDLEAETDPSTTNGLIRQLLTQFNKVAYVGYTATPFANVLIDRDADDVEVEEDLFPKDFILTLPTRPGYVGTERLFGRDALDGTPEDEEQGLDVIRFIPPVDMPAVTPQGVPMADFRPWIPQSLSKAIRDWVLATSARLARSADDLPSSMLIHIHHYTEVQNVLAPQVQELVTSLRNQWRYNPSGSIRDEMRSRWNTEFRPVSARIDPARVLEFDDVEVQISRLLKSPVPVLALNSKSEDTLDYEQNPNLKAVLIGGNRLSRGVTIEGLLVSYYVRESAYMDTLLQMGRWFGYRESYVDLTRLWTTENLASWFREIALREEELRRQILQAELDRLTPTQVGYRIRSHPAMMVTSQAKMGAGKPENVSYEGRMIQTTRFRLDDRGWLTTNLHAARRLLQALGQPEEDENGATIWTGVDWNDVKTFLNRYRTVQDRTTFDADSAAKYIEEQATHSGELTSWQVAIATRNTSSSRLKTEDLGVEGNQMTNTISRTRLRADRSSVGVLTNPSIRDNLYEGDEEIGMTREALKQARHELADNKFESLRGAIIAQRGPSEGLLLIYPISRFSIPNSGGEDSNRVPLFEDPERNGETVIGCAIAFPRSDSASTVEYISGNNGLIEGQEGD